MAYSLAAISVKGTRPTGRFRFPKALIDGLFVRIHRESRWLSAPGNVQASKVVRWTFSTPLSVNPRCTITMDPTGIHMSFMAKATCQNLFCMSVEVPVIHPDEFPIRWSRELPMIPKSCQGVKSKAAFVSSRLWRAISASPVPSLQVEATDMIWTIALLSASFGSAKKLGSRLAAAIPVIRRALRLHLHHSESSIPLDRATLRTSSRRPSKRRTHGAIPVIDC